MSGQKILGLDLGTNSIGWALVDVENQEIFGLGSRIVPMSEEDLSNFEKGTTISKTAERTKARGIRRLIQRGLLRRERLHRILNVLNFLPEHYASQIDFEKKLGQFKNFSEPKISNLADGTFLFEKSYQAMCQEFQKYQPELFRQNKTIPHHWTLYFLRKKALTQKIETAELAWLLLHFNQKRGYYQIRGEEENKNDHKKEEFLSLKILEVQEKEKGKSGIWYEVLLENGWIYRRESKIPLNDWVGKTKDFIVSTDLNEDGTIQLDKNGKEKRHFRSPKEDDWGLKKIKTQEMIIKSGKSVGAYIYEELLKNPQQKINGKLVQTIERDFYQEELTEIVKAQIQFHPELQDKILYRACVTELYRSNKAHREHIQNKDFVHLFVEDLIFYHRPLKSKISQISDCNLEFRSFEDPETAEKIIKPLKGIAKSNPIFQEFRLWQWIKNIKIYQKNLTQDLEVTSQFLNTQEDYAKLVDFLNDHKEISQKQFLKFYQLKTDNYRWNYVEDKNYPCNETRAVFLEKAKKIKDFDLSFFNEKNTKLLWHLLYSVNDAKEIKSAVKKFAHKNKLSEDFIQIFEKFPPYKKEYGSFSEKAIKKLLPLLRCGKYWRWENIDSKIQEKIQKIIHGEFDENITEKVREKFQNFKKFEDFKSLPLWLASYVVYNRHSENSDTEKWHHPSDIDRFLLNFKQHSLRNPIVEQMVIETLRTVKNIWQNYGEGKANFFDEIHIELGRELKKTADERKNITQKNNENENTNFRIKALLQELKNSGISDIRPHSNSQQELLKLYEEGVYLNPKNPEDLEEINKIRKNTNPSKKEIEKYKLWLEQGYQSPYTGETIPLHELFSKNYEIEHIFPQSRFFDDSFNNKIICEAAVNKLKNNQTAMEFIQKHPGEKVTLNGQKTVTILSKEAYESHIKKYFLGNKIKLKNLLSEEIPDSFINRQLNDSRYIAKYIKNLLNKLVREEKNGEIEQEGTSKNLLTVVGQITSKMKQDWGLNKVWNEIITPRFERLNALTNSQNFGFWDHKNGKKVFQIQLPTVLEKGFSKKRIDHRHHALDALVVACVGRNHINYLNYLNAKNEDEKTEKYELKNTLCVKNPANNDQWEFKQPWENFTFDAKNHLLKTIVSFKQNTRILTKSKNKFQKLDAKGKTILVPQTQGENWAVRKALHKDTVFGKVLLKRDTEKWVTLNYILSDFSKIEDLVDVKIKKIIKAHLVLQNNDLEALKKYFKKEPLQSDGVKIEKIKIYEWLDAFATRKDLDSSFDLKKIEKITDLGIQKILINHLKQEKYQNQKDENGKIIKPEILAFSTEGIEAMNENIVALNEGKPHQPIYKVRIYEEGSKFNIGKKGNKKDKYVEAAKGTNLFFAIYQDEKGKRSYTTIPLKDAILRVKNDLAIAPEMENKTLLFVLSPNDLVYVPTAEELENPQLVNFEKLNAEQIKRIYKCVSFSGIQCMFIRNEVAISIADKLEFSTSNKMENTIYGQQIKSICWKLSVNNLGQIIKVEKGLPQVSIV